MAKKTNKTTAYQFCGKYYKLNVARQELTVRQANTLIFVLNEYPLIAEKKSTLPRALRDSITSTFNSFFDEIKESGTIEA